MEQELRHSTPSAGRLVAAFVIAPLVPALILAVMGAIQRHDFGRAPGFAILFGVLYGIVPAILLGIPTYRALKGRIALGPWTSMAVGAFVASVPVVITGLTVSRILLRAAPLTAVPMGALGGLTFWFIALRGMRPEKPDSGSTLA